MLENLNTILFDLKNKFIEILPNILTSIVVLGLGYLLARLIKYLVKRVIKHWSPG